MNKFVVNFACAVAVIIGVSCKPSERPAAADAAASVRACSGSRSLMLADSGVGAVQLGAAVADIQRECLVIRDTIEQGSEAMPQRALYVRFGPGVLRADVMNGHVWRIVVTDTLLHTDDGYGVGTTLEALRVAPNLVATTGEGSLFVRVATHCGLSFQLDASAARATRSDAARIARALRTTPDSARVVRVLVVGCG